MFSCALDGEACFYVYFHGRCGVGLVVKGCVATVDEPALVGGAC